MVNVAVDRLVVSWRQGLAIAALERNAGTRQFVHITALNPIVAAPDDDGDARAHVADRTAGDLVV